MRPLRRFPLFPFSVALYSVLALLAHNISEVEPGVVTRPAGLLLGITVVLLLVLRLLLRDWGKAGLLAGSWMLLFVTYGQLYNFLEMNPTAMGTLGRHRILFPVFAATAFLALWWVVRRRKPFAGTAYLNLLGAVLLVFPAAQIGGAIFSASRGEREAAQWTFSQPLLQPVDPESLPDINFIVLDTYTSSKALARDFGFDNSGFESRLNELGFYIAADSRANYQNTQGSLTSALNLDYLPALTERLKSIEMDDKIWVLLKQSLVRHQLQRIGYQTVAFETSYEWSRIKDADIFLGEARSSVGWQQLHPFERMWANSTALILLNDLEIKTRAGGPQLDHPWSDHIQKQLFVLKTLPEVANNPSPTFTFAHILIPHVPYVFAADGQILTDSGFFGTSYAGPVDEDYLQKGYTGEVAFINNQMETILADILERSETPPIIVVMGDHGMRDENRPQIFYAAHLPGEGQAKLYPSISPVNTFRIIFDTYFGASYGQLPDYTAD